MKFHSYIWKGSILHSFIACLAVASVLSCSFMLVKGYAIQDNQVGSSSNKEFEQKARKIMNIIAAGDVNALKKHISKDGLYIVRRIVNWERYGSVKEENSYKKSRESDPEWLWLDGMTATVWEEYATHLYAGDLNENGFVIKQFQYFIKETRRDFQGETYALERKDAWESRTLGPTAEGKLASNVY